MVYYAILRLCWRMKSQCTRCSSRADTKKQVATMDMEIELKNVESLSKILARLAKLDDVIEAKRL